MIIIVTIHSWKHATNTTGNIPMIYQPLWLLSVCFDLTLLLIRIMCDFNESFENHIELTTLLILAHVLWRYGHNLTKHYNH